MVEGLGGRHLLGEGQPLMNNDLPVPLDSRGAGCKAWQSSPIISAERNLRIHNMARLGAAVVVCAVILALDVTAGILGIQAQAAQNKTKKVTVLFIQCEKPVYKAYQLGLAAAVLLVAAHALANFLGGCACICSQMEFIKASINRKLAATLILLSWIALIVGFSLLLSGAMSNSQRKTSCGFVHGHTLALGGIMCFVHGGITVAYYVTATAAANELP